MKGEAAVSGKLKRFLEYAKKTGVTAAVILLATVIGLLFDRFGINEANIITVYILGTLIISILTYQKWYSIAASLVSVILFNFFFTEPKFTFNVYDAAYSITFLVMFISAFITSNLAARLKSSAKQSELTAYRTKLLFESNKLLQQAHDEKAAASVTANQLAKLLGRDIVFYPSSKDGLLQPEVFSADQKTDVGLYTSDEEKKAARRTFENNKRAGAETDNFSGALCRYLAVSVNDSVYGVVGIAEKNEPLDSFENSIVLSIVGECALAIENLRNIKEKENAAVLAKNEQLRADLLRSISHDLRTPLTAISGNADILISSADNMDAEKRMSLYKDIYGDSQWLISLVENLLSVTRIEDGTMKIRQSSQLIEEVVNEAVSHMEGKTGTRSIHVYQPDEFLIAKADARLIVQVIVNILDNAVKYTPDGSRIDINVMRRGDRIVVEISDNGPGVPDDVKPKIFDMFYTAETKIADSRRSMGLGLALCRSIITAHGGSISVRDNKPTGAVFSFDLPAEEVNLHE